MGVNSYSQTVQEDRNRSNTRKTCVFKCFGGLFIGLTIHLKNFDRVESLAYRHLTRNMRKL